jgi:hypothetical protein
VERWLEPWKQQFITTGWLQADIDAIEEREMGV